MKKRRNNPAAFITSEENSQRDSKTASSLLVDAIQNCNFFEEEQKSPTSMSLKNCINMSQHLGYSVVDQRDLALKLQELERLELRLLEAKQGRDLLSSTSKMSQSAVLVARHRNIIQETTLQSVQWSSVNRSKRKPE